jgi:hypothetical protein
MLNALRIKENRKEMILSSAFIVVADDVKFIVEEFSQFNLQLKIEKAWRLWFAEALWLAA